MRKTIKRILIGVAPAAGLLILVFTGGKKGGQLAPKPTGPKPPAPEPPKIRYALRASASSVDVYPGQPAGNIATQHLLSSSFRKSFCS